MRYVSLSLAAPGLKPTATRRVSRLPVLAGGAPPPDQWNRAERSKE
jgi:hypothetical protein